MVEFETLKAEEVKFGKNNFIEVARKKAVGESLSKEFVAIPADSIFLMDRRNGNHLSHFLTKKINESKSQL